MNRTFKQNWTLQEIDILKEYGAGKCTIQDIAEKINRSPNAIAQKLFRMKYISTPQEARGYELLEKTKVSKHDIVMQELTDIKNMLAQLLEKK